MAAILCVVSYWQELMDDLYGKERRMKYYSKMANIRSAALSGAMTPYRSYFGSRSTLMSQGNLNPAYTHKYWRECQYLYYVFVHLWFVWRRVERQQRWRRFFSVIENHRLPHFVLKIFLCRGRDSVTLPHLCCLPCLSSWLEFLDSEFGTELAREFQLGVKFEGVKHW